MLGVLGIILVAVGICAIEVPKLRRERQLAELWLFMVLLVAGTGIALAINLDARLPSPVDWIGDALRPVHRIVEEMLSTGKGKES